MGRLAIIVTVGAWIAYVIMWFFSDFFHPGYEGAVSGTEEILYLLIVTLLTLSAAAYLLTRLGFMYRTRTHHQVVQQRRRPAAEVQYSWQTPWELLGPVPPGHRAAAIATLPAGPYPGWSVRAVYHAGDKVLCQGLPYEAKWNNQGVSPATESTDPSGSAWKALHGIPGEPSGAPALGSPGDSSPYPSQAATPSG